MSLYSQSREEEVLIGLLAQVRLDGIPKLAVDIGAGDGDHLSNTRFLEHFGWTRVLIDRESQPPPVIRAHVTMENVNQVLEAAAVPQMFGLLSIDIDGNDYWVWKAMPHRPAIAVIEYNPCIQQNIPMAIEYDPQHLWTGDSYYGANSAAIVKLAWQKDYIFMGLTHGLNLFFIRNDLLLRPERIKDAHPPHSPERRWVNV